MAIGVPTQQAFRGISALRTLIEAVKNASANDELDWIEWKSTLDLTGKPGCFHVARAVLGLANRMPDRAARTCEGVGYVVVGAEPGSIQGVAAVDPARLDQTVELYVGSNGPQWSPVYVSVEGRDVLVVTVEPPKAGDPIHALRKEAESARSGTVFVRKPGRTVPADANDLDTLQQRLVARRPVGTVEVDLAGPLPLSWVNMEGALSIVNRWLDQQRQPMIDKARSIERSRNRPPSPSPAGAWFNPLAGTMSSGFSALANMYKPDARTLEDFLGEVDDWSDRVRYQTLQALPQRLAHAGHAVLTLRISNPTDLYLNDVQLVLHIEGDEVEPGDEEEYLLEVPERGSPPRPFGDPIPPDFGLSSGLFGHIAPLGPFVSKRMWIEKGSVQVTWNVGDLRQRSTRVSDPIPVFTRARPADGCFRCTWRATTRDVEGVMEGEMTLPVEEKAVRVESLLADFLLDTG